MATKIRLARGGSKKRPVYRLVVTDSRAPRDGKFIEKIGTYNPTLEKTNENRVVIKKDRVEFWLSKGAVPTEKVVKFLRAQEIGQKFKQVANLNKKLDKKVELKKEEIEKKKVEEKLKREQEEKEAAEAKKAEEEAAKAE